jgi:hypothetical protein
MTISNSFVLSLTGIAVLAYLGHRGADVSAQITLLISAYVGARVGLKASMVHSASRDVDCNTADIISKIER